MKRFAGFVSAAGLVFTVACGQTDAGITTNVKTQLAADDSVKAYQLDVDTDNHIVTLTGNVDTLLAKERAVQIARGADGVTDVIDQIRVGDTAATSGTLDTPDIDVDVKVDDDLERDADRLGDRTADAARRGAEATKDGAETAAEKTKSGAEKAADATADAAKKAGKATVDTTKKVGNAIKDAVTDDDPDSDNDGK